mgnify:CR=1 FL=1
MSARSSFLSPRFDPEGPGAALAVAVDGRPVQVECIGFADIAQQIPITPDTRFDLASVSKTFTAALLLRLAAAGRVDVNGPAADWLPALGRPASGRPITLRDLLAHTSGLPDYLADGMDTPPERTAVRSILDELPRWGAAARPGITHAYANTNYVLLAQVIEAVTGTPFTEACAKELFAPLGLAHTAVCPDPPAGTVAIGYVQDQYGVPRWDVSEPMPLETVGDGGVVSSLTDLLRWHEALWSGEAVPEPWWTRMRTPSRLDSGEPIPYGLALQVEQDAGGRTWVGHGGSWVCSTVLVGRYVEQRTTVLLLANDPLAPVARIAPRAAALLGNG